MKIKIKKMKKKLSGLLLIFVIAISLNCGKSGSPAPAPTPPPPTSTGDTGAFIKGADVSWLPQMEATGFKFNNSSGAPEDCLDILKENGINAIRLRVWVNPSNDKINGHCSKAETVTMAKRAVAKGFKLLIDFHYSDSWADPGKQTKPAAWANDNFSQLLNDVYNHTYDVLDTLQKENCTPTWVQIGNEITGGMLWPEGSTSNWSQLAQLLNKGYAAAKAVDKNIQVIIHIDQGNDNARSRSFFDAAKTNNVNYDIIGLSYYPYWLNSDYTATINSLGNNLNDITSRYQKPVMIVETGGVDTAVQNTYNMLQAVIQKTKAVPNGNGLGVMYLEPEGARSWSQYPLNCWKETGDPTAALSAFN